MLLKSLEGLPNGAHVSVNFKDVKDLGLDLKVDSKLPRLSTGKGPDREASRGVGESGSGSKEN